MLTAACVRPTLGRGAAQRVRLGNGHEGAQQVDVEVAAQAISLSDF
jgi:hypothetical protein